MIVTTKDLRASFCRRLRTLTHTSQPAPWSRLIALYTIFLVVGAVASSANWSGLANQETIVREVSAMEEDTLNQAEQVLISRCMREQGFIFVPDLVRSAADRKFQYVVDDVDWAAQYGYGSNVGRAAVEAKQADPNWRYFQALPPDQQRAALSALNGERPVGLAVQIPGLGTIEASDQGCRAEAQEYLYGDLPTWFQVRTLVSNLRGLYIPNIVQDQRFTEAVADWAHCMRAAGHPYQSPDQIREELEEHTKDRAPTEARSLEIELAVAEATCARRTALATIATELDRYYGDQIRAQYRWEVETKRRLQIGALPRAKEVLVTRP